jgi:hypothetical protein
VRGVNTTPSLPGFRVTEEVVVLLPLECCFTSSLCSAALRLDVARDHMPEALTVPVPTGLRPSLSKTVIVPPTVPVPDIDTAPDAWSASSAGVVIATAAP